MKEQLQTQAQQGLDTWKRMADDQMAALEAGITELLELGRRNTARLQETTTDLTTAGVATFQYGLQVADQMRTMAVEASRGVLGMVTQPQA